mmetsp:Transcript_108559/g.302728  ORF Transcript_108559/g.302728 Transcript_108559/m.302728 type:complete len:292 (+) Transcript_108559:772-1647(+)
MGGALRPRGARDCRGPQLPAQRLRLLDRLGREDAQELRHPRPDHGTPVGAREHPQLRRRPRQRDDHRAVGWRPLCHGPVHVPPDEGPLPPGNRTEPGVPEPSAISGPLRPRCQHHGEGVLGGHGLHRHRVPAEQLGWRPLREMPRLLPACGVHSCSQHVLLWVRWRGAAPRPARLALRGRAGGERRQAADGRKHARRGPGLRHFRVQHVCDNGQVPVFPSAGLRGGRRRVAEVRPRAAPLPVRWCHGRGMCSVLRFPGPGRHGAAARGPPVHSWSSAAGGGAGGRALPLPP